MKSKEEIEQLAKIYVESDIKKNPLYGQFHKTYTDGYSQCQEDMVDKKYTEEDIAKAIRFGQGMELWKEEKQIEDFIQSLNKQY